MRKLRGFQLFLTGISLALVLLLFLILFDMSGETSLNNKKKHLELLHGGARKIDLHSDSYLYPTPWQLVNIPMTYLINSDICGKQDRVTLIILITSHAGDVEFRDKIRETFPTQDMKSLHIRRAFLLGRINKFSTSPKYLNVQPEELDEENKRHGDLVMGDFLESYKNLTYKHLMGLEWVTRYCQQAQYVLKQDDDIAIDYYQLAEFLKEPQKFFKTSNENIKIGQEMLNLMDKFILGKSLINMPVIRNPSSKWFVTHEEYKSQHYPEFVSGWGYLTTPSVLRALLAYSSQEKYFWIDDAHITGTLRDRANISIINMNAVFTQYKGQLMCCLTAGNVKSRNNQPFWCDFLVGPTNDDLNLLSLLQNHSRFCYTTKTCIRRNSDEELNKTCVVTDIRHHQLHNQYHKLEGKAEVRAIRL